MKKIIEKADVLLNAIVDIEKKANKLQTSDLKRVNELSRKIKAGDLGVKIDLKGLSVSKVDGSVLDIKTEEGYALQKYIDDLVLEVEEFEGYPKQ